MAQQESLFEQLAREMGISVEEVKARITARIEAGLHDPDPKRRAQWEEIPCVGDIPTPVELVSYVVKRLRAGDQEDLLRRYLE